MADTTYGSSDDLAQQFMPPQDSWWQRFMGKAGNAFSHAGGALTPLQPLGWALSSISTPRNDTTRKLQDTEAAQKVTGDVLANRMNEQVLQKGAGDLASQFSGLTAAMAPEQRQAVQNQTGSPMFKNKDGSVLPASLATQFHNAGANGGVLYNPNTGTTTVVPPKPPPPERPVVLKPGDVGYNVTTEGKFGDKVEGPTAPPPKSDPAFEAQVAIRQAKLKAQYPRLPDRTLYNMATRQEVNARRMSSRSPAGRQPTVAEDAEREYLNPKTTPERRAVIEGLLKLIHPSMANLADGGAVSDLSTPAQPKSITTPAAPDWESAESFETPQDVERAAVAGTVVEGQPVIVGGERYIYKSQ